MPDRDRPFLFLFKNGRYERLASGEAFPTEFFYGYCELKQQGLPVNFVEESGLLAAGSGPSSSHLVRAVLAFLFGGLPATMETALVLARPANLRRLNQAAAIVATTNTFGLSLALLRRLGLVRSPIVFVPMGALPEGSSFRARWLGAWLLGACVLAPISRREASYLGELIGSDSGIVYLPFGVDARFWTPGRKAENYVLSIGNDRNRDYATLIEAWQPNYPRLKIVTRLKVAIEKANIEIIAGDWHEQLLSDTQVRELIQASRFVVLPIKQTIQPSGQSACLQAMACGKAVVISDIRGLWDRDALRNGESCVLVPVGSVEALRRAIETLINHPTEALRIGVTARTIIETRANVGTMAAALANILSSISAHRPITARAVEII